MMFTDMELDRWSSNEPTWHGRQVGFFNKSIDYSRAFNVCSSRYHRLSRPQYLMHSNSDGLILTSGRFLLLV